MNSIIPAKMNLEKWVTFMIWEIYLKVMILPAFFSQLLRLKRKNKSSVYQF